MIIGLIAIADGLVMTMSRETSTLGGIALFLIGSLGLAFGFPRVVHPKFRPYSRVMLPMLASLLLPILYLPVYGIWWVASPSKLSVWFTVAWAGCWAVSLVATVVTPCPVCGRPFNRSGVRLRLSLFCAHCRASPHSETA